MVSKIIKKVLKENPLPTNIIRKTRSTKPKVDQPIYGISNPNSPNLHVIKTHHPELYKKMQDWD